MATVHVIPVDDLIEHDTADGAGARCVCGPTTELVVSDVDGSDGWLIVHASLDGRELTEPDYAGPA